MKKFQRRQFLQLVAGAAALPAASSIANAQAYPSRPVRLVIGYTPGGSADLTARLMGQWLSEKLGQLFVIENRPGGGTNIATEQVLRATPDGYTLLLVAPANAINATLYDKLNFDFMKEMEPIAGIIRFPNVVVVHPSLPIKTIPELIAYAKANPGKVNMAHPATAPRSTCRASCSRADRHEHAARALQRRRAGADRYARRPDAVMFDNIPTCAEHVRSGKLRALAVTSANRSDVLPDLPLVADSCRAMRRRLVWPVRAEGHAARIVDRLNKAVKESWPIPRRRRGSPRSARSCRRARPPTSASWAENREVGQGGQVRGRQGGLVFCSRARRIFRKRRCHRRYQRPHEKGVLGRIDVGAQAVDLVHRIPRSDGSDRRAFEPFAQTSSQPRPVPPRSGGGPGRDWSARSHRCGRPPSRRSRR